MVTITIKQLESVSEASIFVDTCGKKVTLTFVYTLYKEMLNN